MPGAIIREALGGNPADHVVIFCGSGSTAAINKLVDVLNLRIPADLDDRYGFRAPIPPAERPVVFIGPYEHHSNELPWRESIADVVTDLGGSPTAGSTSASWNEPSRPTRTGRSGSAASRPHRT